MPRISHRRTSDRGFTLIEVLVALAICMLIGMAVLHASSAGLGMERRVEAGQAVLLGAQSVAARNFSPPPAAAEPEADTGWTVKTARVRDGAKHAWDTVEVLDASGAAGLRWSLLREETGKKE